MAKVAGTAFFKVDGTQYSLRGNMNVSLGNVERESVVGMDQYHGIKEIPKAGFIECDLTDHPDVDINTLNQLEDVTVTVELINGKTGVLRNAAQVTPIELNVVDGQMKVRFEGPKGEWIS